MMFLNIVILTNSKHDCTAIASRRKIKTYHEIIQFKCYDRQERRDCSKHQRDSFERVSQYFIDQQYLKHVMHFSNITI